MAGTNDDIEKLYEYDEKLSQTKEKSQNKEDYEGILAAANGNVKGKQLAAQLIPKYFKHFPELAEQAIETHWYLCEDEELAVRVQAIRGLPLLCKDTPEYLARVVEILCQLLIAGDNMERDATNKALVSLLRQDAKISLTALFKHIRGPDDPNAEERTAEEREDRSAEESIREKVICFIRDKLFPLKAELLKPQDEMERHITDLVKLCVDVTVDEFRILLDFLKSLSLFGKNAPVERLEELVEIIGSHADLDVVFKVSDVDHLCRFIFCLRMALPLFMRGASSSDFLNYLNKHIMPVFDKLPEEQKLDLLKNIAECSVYARSQDSRQLLPAITQLLKAPNATNSLCGYKIVTGQPSDRLGEDFTEQYKDFTERLSTIEDLARAMNKKLTQGMAEHNKAMAAAKTEEEKDRIKKLKQDSTTGLRTCNNILAMAQPLHSKVPSFIGDGKINLSWKEVIKSSTPSTTSSGQKRTTTAANGGSGTNVAKRGRGMGGFPNQLVNKAFEGLNEISSGRGRGWRGRGRGRNYW